MSGRLISGIAVGATGGFTTSIKVLVVRFGVAVVGITLLAILIRALDRAVFDLMGGDPDFIASDAEVEGLIKGTAVNREFFDTDSVIGEIIEREGDFTAAER